MRERLTIRRELLCGCGVGRGGLEWVWGWDNDGRPVPPARTPRAMRHGVQASGQCDLLLLNMCVGHGGVGSVVVEC